MKRLAGMATAAALLLAACGGVAHGSGPAGAAPTESRVKVVLSDDMRITLDATSVRAGKVTFTVTNTGKLTHEMVVLKTDLPEDQIPADPTEPDRVSEDASVGETDDMAAGATKVVTLELEPAKYVLICNEPGHYAAGMHTALAAK